MFGKDKKLNIIIDGQFGSTGKGLIAGKLAIDGNFQVFCCNLSPNAGHTYRNYDNLKIVTKQLPVGAILNDRSQIYLTAGSIIDPEILLREMEEFNIDFDRLAIHPRAAVVEEVDRNFEKDPNSSVTKIASTQSGTGSALSRKILRQSGLAQNHPKLSRFVTTIDLMELMDFGCSILMETAQGFDLGINSGLSYPHCTSRDITVSNCLADAQVHPMYLGDVLLSLRTFPIRVGNIVQQGSLLGESGPFYSDSNETTWEELGVEKELTTVTKRVRRVATFSKIQFERALHFIRPTHLFLNFCNYLRYESEVDDFMRLLKKSKKKLYLGFGPNYEQVVEIKTNTCLSTALNSIFN